MKITAVTPLAMPDINLIHFARFCDHRGYFTEPYRRSDFESSPMTPFMQGITFLQMNESFSRAGTVRGLHFQWNPYMGKLVRTIHGHMIDLVLDVRRNAPTFGKIIAVDMPADHSDDQGVWIWVPPGFAHGNLFLEDTSIEYLCSGEYSPECEAGISPLAEDLDWSLCDPGLREVYEGVLRERPVMTDKDRNGLSLAAWSHDARSAHFLLDSSGALVDHGHQAHEGTNA